MRSITIIFILFLSLLVFHSCTKDDIDKEKPVIDLSRQDAFPVNCDTLYFGESFTMKVRFTDNAELGSFSIDIHHNFDHHSHSTEVTECDMDPVKEPVNPYVFIQDYDIPSGMSEYVTDVTIALPSGDNNGLYDEGDYHFFLSLTDAEGWSAQKGLSVKMVRR
jgi:hypothetical protein